MFDRLFTGILVLGLAALATSTIVSLMFVAPKVDLPTYQLERVIVTAQRAPLAGRIAVGHGAQPVMQRAP